MSRRRNSNFQFQYSQCEPRQLLTSITLNGGELLLGGGTTNDVGTVSTSGSNITASLTGVDTMSFPLADVTSIRFVGLGGDDQFTNNTSLPSFAFGQAGNDTLIGGSGMDRLVGGTGTDVITGNGGDDELVGGAGGMKLIDGGDGNDKLFGGTGTNEIRGGDGDDIIHGGPSIDMIFGDAGDDQLFPGQGMNTVRGGSGNDTVIAGADVDMIFGDDGNDRLYGGDGNDEIDGGDGDDAVVGRKGNDQLKGGDGNDYMRGNDGDDILEGEAGDDRLQGDRGDDMLRGGSNTSEGFDRVLLDGVLGRYRISGDDLISKDMVGEDGLDNLDGMEWLHYIDEDDPDSHAAESQIKETVTIQPIIVSNTNGSNTAEYFGTADEEAEIKSLINDIWYQAKIQVNFLTPNTWDNNFANVGNGGTRPDEDAFRIFDDGAAAGVTHPNARVINMYFVEIVPGFGNLTELQTNGRSLDEANGVVFQVGDDLPGFDAGRVAVARVASHEIAHNFGLDHVGGSNNLMSFPEIRGDNITAAQAATLIASEFSRA